MGDGGRSGGDKDHDAIRVRSRVHATTRSGLQVPMAPGAIFRNPPVTAPHLSIRPVDRPSSSSSSSSSSQPAAPSTHRKAYLEQLLNALDDGLHFLRGVDVPVAPLARMEHRPAHHLDLERARGPGRRLARPRHRPGPHRLVHRLLNCNKFRAVPSRTAVRHVDRQPHRRTRLLLNLLHQPSHQPAAQPHPPPV